MYRHTLKVRLGEKVLRFKFRSASSSKYSLLTGITNSSLSTFSDSMQTMLAMVVVLGFKMGSKMGSLVCKEDIYKVVIKYRTRLHNVRVKPHGKFTNVFLHHTLGLI